MRLVNDNKYVDELSEETRQRIKNDLLAAGIEDESDDLLFAMHSRLCDLEDTIDIKKYL